jgi:hemolysin activation/secretion protein
MISDTKPLQILKVLFVAMIATLDSLAVYAQVQEPPSAGLILQQVQPVAPPSPAPNGAGLLMKRKDAGRPSPSAPFLTTKFQIIGNTLFDTQILHALVADAEGKQLILSQLDELATRITKYYNDHNYPLARAIIPAQTIQSGVVRIEVIEARYGMVSLDNKSQVKDSLVAAIVSQLQSGQAIGQRDLDHTLTLLSEIPGVVLSATLNPGEKVGTSDLIINTAAGPNVTRNMVLDNHGGSATGRVRAGATVNVINPLQYGDILTLNGLSSGAGMNYARIDYEALLNGQGTRLGGSYSQMNYTLLGSFAVSNAYGSAQVQSVRAVHPLLRSRSVNLSGKVKYDQVKLRDHFGTNDTDRHLDHWTISLDGNAKLPGSSNSWYVGWTLGSVGFDNAQAQSSDLSTANTQGSFAKLNINLTRRQTLTASNSLYLAYSGQWANTNLDSSQKMSAGGPSSVRAYNIGAVSGDSGHLVTMELQHNLSLDWGGQWQAVAFVDRAQVTVNQKTWGTGTDPNLATLLGAGLGLNWTGLNQLSVKAYIATPAGSTPTPSLVAGTESVRAWVGLSRGF